MKLTELKSRLESKSIDSRFMVFVCDGDYFLANQYLDEICRVRNKTDCPISSGHDSEDSAFALQEDSGMLYVLKTDVFSEVAADYSMFEDVVVVCDKIDQKLSDALGDSVVVFPKLQEWQIKDYMAVLCPGLEASQIDWLYEATAGDIYQIKNELDKVALFDESEQKEVFEAVRFEPGANFYEAQLFKLADSVIKGDRAEIYGFMQHEADCDIDPIALANVMLKTLKNIALIKLNSGATAEEIGVSEKQYFAYKKYLYNGYPQDRLFKNIEFLSGIDLRLKSSELDMTKDRLLDYILIHVAQ